LTIDSSAALESKNGRFYTFSVTAHNGMTEIGKGTVTRAVVIRQSGEERR
jgi:predicted thioesterase